MVQRRAFDLVVFTVGWSVASSFAPPAARSDEVSDFYAGKNVQLVIGYATGGGYDDYARMLGRHIGRHIPGNPTIVPQNMPGAGSIRAANYLYNVAPKDGTMIGMVDEAIYLNQMLGTPQLRIDAAKFNWIGRILANSAVLYARRDAAV